VISWRSDKRKRTLSAASAKQLNSRQVTNVDVNFMLYDQAEPLSLIGRQTPLFSTGPVVAVRQAHSFKFFWQQLAKWRWRHCWQKISWVVFRTNLRIAVCTRTRSSKRSVSSEVVPEFKKDRNQIESMYASSRCLEVRILCVEVFLVGCSTLLMLLGASRKVATAKNSKSKQCLSSHVCSRVINFPKRIWACF
jgi:hypothetical protein